MQRFPLVLIAITVVLLLAGVFFLSSKSQGSKPTNLYFWSTTCPHCAKVAAFMDTWEGKDKILLDKKEVSDPANAALFEKKATECNIPPAEMGVPLLVTPQGKCYSGDQPIIDYFKSLKFDQPASPSASSSLKQ